MPSLTPLLSPRDLGRALGVSESTVKRWVDSGSIPAERTQGGHRRINTLSAIRFIRERGAPLQQPGILGLDELVAAGSVPRNGPEQEKLYRDLLISGDASGFRGQLMGAYLRGDSVSSLCDGPIRCALRHVGELYRDDPMGIFIEHRASDICMQALQQLRTLIATPADGPVALGGAAPDDPYLLPSIMVSIVLESVGYRTTNLGPDTPFSALRRAVEIERPRLVWLSVSVCENRRRLAHSIRELTRQISDLGGTLLVGGRAVEHMTLPPLDAVVEARNLGELSSFARGLASGAASSTEERPQWRDGA